MSQSNQSTIFIAGGTRGLGKHIALHLAKNGTVKRFFLNYLQNDLGAKNTVLELSEYDVEVHLLKYNLAFPQEIKRMFFEIKTHTQQLDYFVHSAALTVFKPLHKVKPNQWDLTLNVSAKSFLECTRACLAFMPDGGKIVAISGIGSQYFTKNYGALGVAKSALESTVRYLAVELAEYNIQVNGVRAGLIESDEMPLFPEIDLMRQQTLERTPARRLGTGSDVAKSVCFLLTQADWMYGQCLTLDGGFSLT